jgi:succinoglycan biosynthesis transport protein ExoP
MRNLPINSRERQVAQRDDVAPDYINVHATNAHTSEDSLITYLNILRRRKWYIIIPLLIIVPITVLMLAMKKPAYQSKVRLSIENDSPQVLEIKELLQNENSPNFYMTEYQLIKARENLEKVVDILRLDEAPPEEAHPFIQALNSVLQLPRKVVRGLKQRVMGMVTPAADQAVDAAVDPAEMRRMAVVAAFASTIQVTPIQGTRLVDITVTGHDPHAVAQQVNTLTEVYLRNNLEKKLETSRKAIAWLAKKTADLKQKAYASELELQDFREKQNLVPTDFVGKGDLVHVRLAEIHAAYAQANTARVAFEAELNKLKSLSVDDLEHAEIFSSITDASLLNLNSLRRTYLDLLAQYSNLATIFKPKHPRMVQLQSQIDATKRALRGELQKIVNAKQAEYDVLQTKEDALARELEAQKAAALRLSKNMITYNDLQGEVGNQLSLYQEAAKRLQEIRLTQALITNNVKIIERGEVPLFPVASKDTMQLFLSLILGCVLGAGLAFIREYFDHSFKDAGEIEDSLRIPLLGIIPRYAPDKHRGSGPISLYAPRSTAAEAYRLLRTRIFSCAPDLRTLLVTSAVPSEGKSTTVANLGISFAQLGLKVLLLDTDLRCPTLHRYFQLQKDRGLTSILEQEGNWQQMLQETSLPNLQVVPAGPTPLNPSDVLSLKSLRQLFEQLKNAFDLVLVDAPLTLSLPDVEILAPDMDGVLLVHAPEQCDKQSVLEAKNRLERVRAHILGIVLNDVKEGYRQHYRSDYYQSYHTYDSSYHYDNKAQKTIEPYSLSQNSVTLPQKITQIKSRDIDIIIHDFQLDKALHGRQSIDHFLFLILDVEISNKLNTPYIFSPQKSALYIDMPDQYGMALSSMLNTENYDQQDMESEGVYKYNNVTHTLKGGMVGEQTIQPHKSIRGLIVFHVPENMHNFVFSYGNEFLNISISPIENS